MKITQDKQQNVKNALSFGHIGILVCGICSVSSLYLFVLSLPGIGIGIWPQSEMAVTGLHLSSALCALGLCLIAMPHKKLVTRALLHPYALVPCGLGLLSLLMLPFYDLPVRHLLGAPQTGEGIIWWFDWGILTATALLLFRFSFWKKMLIGATLTSIAITMFLCMNYKYYGVHYTPYYFPDFLALSYFCLIPLICRFPFPGKFIWPILYILLLVLLHQVENKAAFAYGLLGIPFFAVLRFWPFFSGDLKTRLGLITLVILPVAALFLMLALPLFIGDDGYYDFRKILPLRTVLSRSYLIEVGLSPLMNNPFLFLTGTGWGTFTEHVVSGIPSDWYNFTLERRQQWEGISWDQFHTHNMYIDTLFSIGFAGALLVFAYIMALPVFAKKSMKWPAIVFTGGLISAVSFWFLLPLNMPFIALALGAMGKSQRALKFFPDNKFLISGVLAAIFLLQLTGTGLNGLTMKNAHRYMPQTLSITQAQSDCPMEYNDFGAGGLHLARMLMGRTRALIAQAEEPEKINPVRFEKERKKVSHLFCQAQQYTASHKHISNRLLVAQLLVQSEVSLGLRDYLDPADLAFYEKGWKENLMKWLETIPARTDQAVPFLLWSLMNGDETSASEIANVIYSANVDDPVGLWFTGITMIATPSQTHEGLRRMRSAIDNGIERYMPLEDEIKQQLMPSQ